MKIRKKPAYSILQSIRFMVATAWRVRKGLVFSCIAIILVSVVLDVLRLYVAKGILSRIENGSSVGELVGTVAFFFLSISLLAGLQRYFTMESKTIDTRSHQIDVRRHIRSAINVKAGTTSYPNTADPNVQKLLAAALDATDGFWSATEIVWFRLQQILYSLICFVIYLFLLTNLNAVLIVVSVATTVGGFLLQRRLDAWMYQHKQEESECLRQIRYVNDRATSSAMAKEIRIFGMKPWLDNIYDSALRLYRNYLNRRDRIILLGDLLNLVMQLLRNGIAYGYLIHMALAQGMPASEFLLYFKAVGEFTERMVAILSHVSLLNRDNVELSSVQEYLNLPEPFLFEGGEPVPECESYSLELRDITFRYPGSTKPIFERFNLTIAQGEKLAVVGLNGAGKTTLVNLLCGFFDPDEGTVLLNGTDIRRFNRGEYYKLFCAVFQKYSIVEATVAENITLDVVSPDLKRLDDCLAHAGLQEKISELPKGIHTHLGREVYLEGVMLSGGLTQRLLLARALYKNAPILVLDEPTSALDPLAEHDIYTRYNAMTKGKTSLFISHRLASTRFCDRIILLENGSVAEEGTHEQLLNKKGKYADLFQIQSRYYQEGGCENG